MQHYSILHSKLVSGDELIRMSTQKEQDRLETGLSVEFLGTSSSIPSYYRNQPSLLLHYCTSKGAYPH